MDNRYSIIDQANKVLKDAIGSIEASKEEIVEIVEHSRDECRKIEKELDEIRAKVDEIIKEVDLLEERERKGRLYLSTVSKNFNIYEEDDIKQAYDEANAIRTELLLKREEEKNLRNIRSDKEFSLKSAIEVHRKAERVAKAISVATGYLKGNIDDLISTIGDLKKRQALGIKIIEAQEDERGKLARDIHDGPAQSMASILIKAELCEKLMDIDRKRASDELRDLKNVTKATLRDTRKIIYDLRPMVLDDLGLIPILQKYIRGFERDNEIEIEFKVIGNEKKLESGIEIAIFRIIQESLANILKHSQATTANIAIEYLDARLNLSIRDNGVGFDQNKIDGAYRSMDGGFGLISINERVELLDGKLQIDTSPGKGTNLRIYVPLTEGEDSYVY
ncbi:MAG: sensor histidine kinase [Tissierellia bacterium]|nr:sensor histidine kinase [Tissierellia bacterium]